MRDLQAKNKLNFRLIHDTIRWTLHRRRIIFSSYWFHLTVDSGDLEYGLCKVIPAGYSFIGIMIDT